MYGYKGPFNVWEVETEEERLEAITSIAEINAIAEEEAKRMRSEWKSSQEYKEINNGN